VTELHELTALEQAAAIRSGELDPVELVEHYLRRIDAASPRLGAFVTVTADRALEQARAAQRSLARQAEPLPPLLGVPIAVKDLSATAGIRTMFGSRVLDDFVPDTDDFVVSRLAAAGTVLLGKTNTPEFGLPCYTEPDVAPPARTPWDLDRSAGGSSGGAAAAVAGGLVGFAQGSDGGGSIRIPASVCGLVGLKSSRGRVSNGPLGADVTGLGCHGPLTRTVADAAALLDAMSGTLPGDAFALTTERFRPHPAPPGRLVVARSAEPFIADIGVHPECLAGYDSASSLLTELGHTVVDFNPALPVELVGDFETVWAVNACAAPVPPEREVQLRPLTRWLRERGRAVSGPEFLAALSRLRLAARQVIESLQDFDALLTPTLASPPVGVGTLRNDADPAADFAAQKAFTPFTALANLTGQPAISLPLHWSGNLPIGVQLIGRPAGEAGLLALAAQLEEARPWAYRRPAGW
jgi:amidase